jgi:hypothetical protein
MIDDEKYFPNCQSLEDVFLQLNLMKTQEDFKFH